MNTKVKEKNDTPHEEKVYFPTNLLVLRHRYTLVMMRLLMAMVRKLQPYLRKQFGGLRQEECKVFPDDRLIDGWVIIGLPLRMVETSGRKFTYLRKALRKMCEKAVRVPIVRDGDCEWVRLKRLFFVKYAEKCSLAEPWIYLDAPVANYLFSLRAGYFQVRLSTFMACQHVSTMMMYLFAEKWRHKGVAHVNTNTLAGMLQSEDHYRSFATFRRKKLDVARRELMELYRKGRSEVYFSYEPVYQGSNVWGEPDHVIIRIHSVVTPDSNAPAVSRQQLQAGIAQMLEQRFSFRRSEAVRLASHVNERNYDSVVRKLDFINRRRRRIDHLQAYTRKVVMLVVKQLEPPQPEQTQMQFAA